MNLEKTANTEVYVVAEAFCGRLKRNAFCAVFSTEKKALEECKRLAECAKMEEAKFWERFDKRNNSEGGTRVSVVPGRRRKGFAVTVKFEDENESCHIAYYVHKKFLDDKSPKYMESIPEWMGNWI